MPMTINRDIVTGSLTLALGAVIFVASFGVKDFAATGVGAGFMPRLAAMLFALLGSVLLLETWRSRRAVGAAKADRRAAPRSGGLGPVLLSACLMAAYVGLLNVLGFVVASALYVFCQTLILAKRAPRRYVLFAVIAVVTSVAAYNLFVRAFQVMLPTGVFG